MTFVIVEVVTVGVKALMMPMTTDSDRLSCVILRQRRRNRESGCRKRLNKRYAAPSGAILYVSIYIDNGHPCY